MKRDGELSADSERPQAALIVTAIEGMEEAAAVLAQRLGLAVEIASTRAAALRLLDRRIYDVVILDQMLAEADTEGADLIWKRAGLAIPLQFSFALAGTARLERETRAAMVRRERELHTAAVAAAAALDGALKNAVTAFLLESQLALAEDGVPPPLKIRLEKLAGLASQLREHLDPAAAQNGATVGLRPVTQ